MSANENPLDSLGHCILRKAWVIENYGLLTNNITAIYYIAETFFYRTNCYMEIKILKLVPNKKVGTDKISFWNYLSKQFQVNSMIMGVVVRSSPHRNFNGNF